MGNKEKIIDTITKLRNLATDNANPEEAANAAALMQDMLFKHNLTEFDLRDELGKTPEYEKEIIDLGVSSPQSKQWKAYLMHILAMNNFCKLINNTNNAEVWLIGQEDNRMVVKYIYDYLSKDLIKMGKLAAKEAKKDVSLYRFNSTLWKKSFFSGANNAINTRLREQKRYNIAVADGDGAGRGTALALKIDNALRDATQALVGRTRESKSRRSRIDYNGYSAGTLAGNNAKLNQELPNRRLALT
jgi:hypothetical protein